MAVIESNFQLTAKFQQKKDWINEAEKFTLAGLSAFILILKNE